MFQNERYSENQAESRTIALKLSQVTPELLLIADTGLIDLA
jgi:hypothetical protein